MAVTLLIAASDAVTKLTYTNSDSTMIKDDHIRLAQYNYIRPELGETMYEDILSEKGSSWTGLNETLYDDYIKPAVCWFTLAKAARNIVYQSSSNGIFENAPDFSFSKGEDGLAKFVDYCEDMGAGFIKEMHEYISENSTSFGDYAPETDNSAGRVILY